MTYTVEPVDDAGGMACEVKATAKSGKYEIDTEYIADPNRNSVLMRVQFKPHQGGYQLYLRFDPTVNGNGGGGPGNGGADSATVDNSPGHPVLVAFDPVTATNAVNRDYAQPVYEALDGPLADASSGLAGTASDTRSTPPAPDATNGNVVQHAKVALNGDGGAMLALGFGASQGDAVAAAEGSLGTSFDKSLDAYSKGWKKYDNSLTKPHTEKLKTLSNAQRKQLEDEYYLSANVLKASEDKTFPGAIVASLASPWGQAISAGDPNNTYFGSYREVFARDLYEAWTGLLADGDLDTARAATLFLFNRQQLADGSMPRNSLVNGKTAPDSFGTQLDEASYPILMAYQLGMTDAPLYHEPHQAGGELRRRARAVVRRRAMGGAGRILALYDRGRDRRPRRRGRDREGERRPDLGGGLARHRRRLAALRQGLDRHDQRPAGSAVLHPPVEDGRSERGDLVRGRKRRPDARPASGDRRRLPRTRAPRRAPGHRPGRHRVAAGRRRDDQVDYLERPGLAPVQRRRLRRPGQRRAAVGADRPGHGTPVAGAVGRARRAVARDRRPRRCRVAAPGHERVRVGRRPDPRAGLGDGRSRRFAVRHRPGGRLDRFPEREGGGLGVAAHLVGRLVRAARRRPRTPDTTWRSQPRRPRGTSGARRERRRSR